MQIRQSTSPGRAIFACVLLGVAGLLAAASSSHSAQGQRPAPPATYLPSGPDARTVQFSQSFRYRGGHPIHPDFGHGFCNDQGSHTHVYAPFEPELFTLVSGEWVFIGDPADFGYDGPVYWYANPHPWTDDYGGGWCYYPWPHRHAVMLGGAQFNLVGGILYYIGDFAGSFFRLLAGKRDFFRLHYRKRYLRGRLYKLFPRRYGRLGPGRYRVLRPRRDHGFRPYRARPRRTDISAPGGLTRRHKRTARAHTPRNWRRIPRSRLSMRSGSRIDRGVGVRIREGRSTRVRSRFRDHRRPRYRSRFRRRHAWRFGRRGYGRRYHGRRAGRSRGRSAHSARQRSSGSSSRSRSSSRSHSRSRSSSSRSRSSSSSSRSSSRRR